MQRINDGSLLWVGALALPVAAAAAASLADGRWLELISLSHLTRLPLSARLLLTESGAVMLAAPLAGVWVVITAAPPHDTYTASHPAMHRTWRAARRVIGATTAMIGISMVLTLVAGAPDEATLWSAHAVLWASTLALAALGVLCAAVWPEPLDATAAAVGGAVTISAGLLLAGPLLELFSRPLLEATLLTSPFVATALSAGIDIFRIDPLYQLSPVAHTAVNYPAGDTAVAWYLTITLLLFSASVPFLRRRSAVLSLERISA